MLSTDALSALATSELRAGQGRPGTGPTQKNDAEALRDFEHLLLSEVLKGSVRSNLGGEHALSGGSAGEMYREMFMDTLAGSMADAGGVGIARSLAEAAARRSLSTEERGDE